MVIIKILPAGIKNPYNKKFPVSYTHLRAHETPEHLVCRLLLEKDILVCVHISKLLFLCGLLVMHMLI